MTTRRGKAMIAGLLAAALCAAALGFRQHRSRLVQSVGAAARHALAQRRYDDARAEIARWKALAPRSGEPDYVAALVEMALQDPDGVLDALKRASDLGFDEDKLRVVRAIYLTRAGQYAEAEAILKPAFIAQDEPKIAIAEAMARVFLSTYRLTEANVALDRWIQNAPDDPRPYLWRNEIEERIGTDSAETIRNYRTALRLDPNLDKARLGLAEVLLKAHQNDESEVEFAKFLERNPESVPGRVGAAQIAVLKGDLVTATRQYEEVLKLDPDNLTALRELGLIEFRGNKLDSALSRLKKAIALSPFDVTLHFNYAQVLKASGQDDLAARENAATERLRRENAEITKLRDDLSLHPNDAALRIKVAKWLLDHGHEEEGLQWAKLILKEHPGHQPTYQLLVEYHERKGNAGLANYYRTATQSTAGSSR